MEEETSRASAEASESLGVSGFFLFGVDRDAAATVCKARAVLRGREKGEKATNKKMER